ncbi:MULTISPECIES: hypothetical protein [unclassified Microbulbifer]|uniref:hypothetical protein n=1 Tax=unclassified Microbulbifer TaxID=2619833 RepID=UPI0027E441BE|nr:MULTISPECIES: hypothetical protein [unclassified Microbulbifer]
MNQDFYAQTIIENQLKRLSFGALVIQHPPGVGFVSPDRASQEIGAAVPFAAPCESAKYCMRDALTQHSDQCFPCGSQSSSSTKPK